MAEERGKKRHLERERKKEKEKEREGGNKRGRTGMKCKKYRHAVEE